MPGFELIRPPDDLDIASAVISLASTANVANFVSQIEPHFYHYALLKAALERYRLLAQDPSMTQLPKFG